MVIYSPRPNAYILQAPKASSPATRIAFPFPAAFVFLDFLTLLSLVNPISDTKLQRVLCQVPRNPTIQEVAAAFHLDKEKVSDIASS
jgi:hypothetical protein